MTTTGEGGHRRQDSSLATDEFTGALEDSEGLDWASAGLWADVAVRSDPERVERTVSALTKALNQEGAVARRARRRFRAQLIAAIMATSLAITVIWQLLAEGLAKSGRSTVLVSVLSVLIGLGASSAAGAFTTIYLGRRARREREVIKKVIEYQKQRLAERDSLST